MKGIGIGKQNEICVSEMDFPKGLSQLILQGEVFVAAAAALVGKLEF